MLGGLCSRRRASALSQHGPITFGWLLFGVSSSPGRPRMAAVRRCPSAAARPSRSWRLSSPSRAMRSVAACSRRSREASVARCRSGGTAVGERWWRSRSRWISSRRSVSGSASKHREHGYRPRRRCWWKVRTRATADAVVGGVIGPLNAPEALLLGLPDGRAGCAWRVGQGR